MDPMTMQTQSMATSSRTYGPMFISGGWVLNGDYNVTTFDVQWLEETLRRLIQDQLENRQFLSLPDRNPLLETTLRQSRDECDSGYLLDRYFEMSVSHQRSASGSTTPSMQVSSLRASSTSDGASFLSAVEYLPRERGRRGVLPLTTQIQIFVKGVPGRSSLLIPVDLDDRIIEVENRIRRRQDVPKFDFRFSHHGRRLDEFDTVRGIGLKTLSTLTCGPIMVRSLLLSVAPDCIEIIEDDGRSTHSNSRSRMIRHTIYREFSMSLSLSCYGKGENTFIQHREEIDKHLRSKLNFEKRVPRAKGAIFNSYGGVHRTYHPAAQVDLLCQDWTQQSQTKSIFRLSAIADTDKSTISWTVTKSLTDPGYRSVVDYSASSSFKSGEGDRGWVSRFFPTIARQLLRKVNVPAGRYNTLVLVVDLDECEKEAAIKTILNLWSGLPQITTNHLELFLRSRPEV